MRIDEMPAGREMDKAISRYIFGNTKFCCKDYDDDYHAIKEPNGCFVNYELVPRYSTDIAAAWQVVEQVTKTQCDDTGSFYVFKIVKKHHKWCTYIKHPLWMGIHNELGKNYEMYQAYADTAPLAICRCALKAMGGAY